MEHMYCQCQIFRPNMAITSSEEAQLNPVDRKAPSRNTVAVSDEKAKALIAEPVGAIFFTFMFS